MKILILCDHFGTGGGAGTIASWQAEELSKSHTIEVLAAKRPENLEKAEYKLQTVDLSYNLKFRNFRGLKNNQALKILKYKLNSFKPEVVLIHNLHTYWSYACLPLIKQHQAKSILVFHDVSVFTNYSKLCHVKYQKTPLFDDSGFISESGQILSQVQDDYLMYKFNYKYPWYKFIREYYYGVYNPFRQKIIKKYLTSATKTVAVSHALAEALRQNNIKVDTVIHNRIPTTSPQPNTAKLSYNHSLLMIGRINKAKGSLQAIKYLSYLKNKHNLTPELRLAGVSDLSPELTKLARQLGVINQVKPLGWLTGKAYQAELASCGLVIVPSICFDSFPTVVLEAYQYKKPVVATIFGGAKEIVQHNKTGFIADPFQIEVFAEHIKTLLTDQTKARCMGQAGYQKIKQYFSLERQTVKLLSFIKDDNQ